jgi:Flp pilus assembly protein TadG
MFHSRAVGAHRIGLPRRGERGAAVVEFALVLPILVLIVFGIINFGIVLAQKAALSNGVRIGARYGSVNAYTATHSCKNVLDTIRGSSTTLGIGATNNTQIGVTVYRVKSDGTKTTMCSAAAGVASTGASTTAPCVNASADPADPDTLQIDTTFDSKLLIPTPGLGTSFTLTNSSSFQCEYSK